MRTITGIFTNLSDGLRALEESAAIVGKGHVNLLTHGPDSDNPNEVPTTQDMAPVGGAMIGIMGGALGVATALFIPGLGTVSALGILAATALGILGGAIGFELGDSADRFASTGLPVDELYFYESALKQNRTVVFVLVPHKAGEESIREVLTKHGAESLDAARDDWTIGLHDAEEAEYEPPSPALESPSTR